MLVRCMTKAMHDKSLVKLAPTIVNMALKPRIRRRTSAGFLEYRQTDKTTLTHPTTSAGMGQVGLDLLRDNFKTPVMDSVKLTPMFFSKLEYKRTNPMKFIEIVFNFQIAI